ncbi:SUN domain-containing protein 3-like isoform X2 [Amphiprion ocellaris]|uniref:SUN domain-containing protein n=2 Tax=Amphiprion ocellaris TaxID=80972 RepID=A0AAQ5YSZ8_AMPOC|nr:SUN domain-containing protein 3-like isoform X2 [Amphiprion ocellaris]XP_054869309.1 SUN domain-containing protein 3-like isoform X2 [Amphiprion ocellaris]XP_054869313.1 SUN domain-containing protein 3-like isoform X2 [Amphiprion ocellaris]
MPQGSLRLAANGYYHDDGQPVISYKENTYRVFRRQRQTNGLRSEGGTKDVFETPSDQRSSSLSTRKTLVFFLLLIPLCFGLLQWIPPQSNISSPSVPLELSDSTIAVDMKTRYEELMKQLKEQQEELLWLKKKINHLLPKADMLSNFALESLGACVLKSSEPFPTETERLTSFGRRVRQRLAVTPSVVIQGQPHLIPGHCWAFAGQQGHVSIALSHQAAISHVTLGHISKASSSTGSISSAPKEFSVYGRKNLDDENIHLGTFLYDEDGDSLQTFKLLDHKKGVFSYVTLQVHSNWGMPEYTCLYSFRVHGKLAD